jgi:hypothetical protein
MTTVVKFVRAEAEQDAVKADAKLYAANIERIYTQVGSHIANNAALASKHGRETLLAKLPSDVAAAIVAVETGLATVWAAMSEESMPEIPAQPQE